MIGRADGQSSANAWRWAKTFAASRRVLKQAFELPPAAMPPSLQKLLAAPAPPAASLKRHRRRARWPLALAASLLLGLGLVMGRSLQQPAPDALSLVLETLPSGELHRTAEGEIVALSTLAAADGGLCREYEHRRDGSAQRGLACREPGGHWHERALPAAPAPPPDADSYQLAGGEPVDAALALNARRLSLAEERQRLARRWN